jgi:hypothetical protein
VEILGSLSSRTEYKFKNVALSFENLRRSGLLQKIKEKYSFSEQKTSPNAIIWQGGSFMHNSKEVLINQAMLDGHEESIGAVVMGESSDSSAFLDSLCKFIDSFKLFDTLCDAKKTLSYNTMGRVKLNVPPTGLMSKDYLEFLNERSKLLKTEHYDVEIQPIGLAVAILLKPNLSAISKLSLDVTEIARILESAGSKIVQLAIADVSDYNDRIYTFSIGLASDAVRKMLTDLEKQFSGS